MDLVIAFIVGVIVGLLVGWYYWGRQIGVREAQSRTLQTSIGQKDRSVQDLQTRLTEREATIEQLQAQLHPDDLAKLEGIGPKIDQLLKAAGIYTFKQLAAADVGRLQTLVKEADLAFADPTTWPQQAKLAAAGDWPALEALQAQLKGGRQE